MVEYWPHLVGVGLRAGCAVRGEMAFPGLDVVFGLTTGAIDFLIKDLAATVGQTGHNETHVAPLGPDLDARNHAAFLPP